MDRKSVQDWEDYARTIGAKHKNISPRFAKFISKLRRSCQNILKRPDCKRKEYIKDLAIDAEMVRSRWEVAHARDGLCVNLVESVQAMMEVRLYNEYGDYTAMACKALKNVRIPQADGEKDWVPRWTVESLDWQTVAAKIAAEEQELARISETITNNVFLPASKRQAPYFPTPYVDEVRNAAERLGISSEHIEWEIDMYAKRNSYYHSAVEKLIDTCDWPALGDRLLQDLDNLGVVHYGSLQARMQETIIRIRDRWLDICERQPSGQVVVFGTVEALEKTKRMLSRKASKEFSSGP